MYIASRETPDVLQDRLTRLIDALRRRYPRHTAKLVARDIGCDPRTVEGWLAGQPPGWKHLDAMLSLYGDAFAAEVMMPGSPRHHTEALRAQLDVLERSIQAIRDAMER